MSDEKIYRLDETFEQNVLYGPFWEGITPEFPKTEPTKTFMGKRVHSLLGVSASPFTFTSRGIEFCSRMSYDIITYRSVRTVEWRGLGAPNWCYVDLPDQLTESDLKKTVLGSIEPFAKQEVSTANSFGIQSYKPEYWQREYEIAKSKLHTGQVLLLALMITPEDGQRDAISDARLVAQYANETSAEILEINLACPNSGSSSLIYEDIDLSTKVCAAVKEGIGKKHLLAKVGYYSDVYALRTLMENTKGIIAGITSTNTYSMQIQDKNGKPFFPGRSTAGVSGGAIRSLSMKQVKEIARLRKELELSDFVIIGVGGVTKPEHVQDYLEAGADAVQAVAGILADPYLAQKYKKEMYA